MTECTIFLVSHTQIIDELMCNWHHKCYSKGIGISKVCYLRSRFQFVQFKTQKKAPEVCWKVLLGKKT